MNIKNEPIEVLSLFDGIACLRQALKELNINVKKYNASEICKNAIKVATTNHPDIIQIGDVRDVNCKDYNNISLMAFGSPCQSLSSLKKERTGLDSQDSGLFYEALRILKEVKPKYFIMENVASMPERDKNIITDLLGVEPIRINSALVGPALRDRLYWTNIPGISNPEDKNILLEDIIEDGYADRDKAPAILTKNIPYTKNGLKRYLTKSIGQVVFHSKEFAKLPKKEKLEHIESMTNDEAKALFRPFTVSELEQCQTLPIGYVGDILRKTPSQHAIGNAFSLSVIKHILVHANFN
ncbi:DNA cytosine methyltransferase [uncultured Winogradskyella sp.]|uniref:DNA cytosine methyltransferase n=1 Tax=uncultured Winogradskyella sp. TaxID=395353 RepID=UPI002609627F|nr:DNA cytosine methyltransferase [uncultured Winogradskyella sp.]